MVTKFLTALPVYNEVGHVEPVLDEVLRYSPHVLVVDDGSTDGTSQLLARRTDIQVIRHEKNRGYGAGLKSAFAYALAEGYDVLVTIDCDGQHQPRLIPDFVTAAADADIVSGSRYLAHFAGDSVPPAERLKINQMLTDELNRRLGLRLTDAFCGFKAYRADALSRFDIDELGYAMPIEVWAQASHAGLKIVELPVHLIYLEEERSFGGALDNAAKRLDYYRQVLDRCLAAIEPPSACTSPCGD
jgi:glycosyltransferase involved in cell wall biosynthesis